MIKLVSSIHAQRRDTVDIFDKNEVIFNMFGSLVEEQEFTYGTATSKIENSAQRRLRRGRKAAS